MDNFYALVQSGTHPGNLALLDSGVDRTHSAIKDHLIHQIDFTESEAQVQIGRDFGHGTKMAGIMFGKPIISNFYIPITTTGVVKNSSIPITAFIQSSIHLPVKASIVWDRESGFTGAVVLNVHRNTTGELVYTSQGDLETTLGEYQFSLQLPPGAYYLTMGTETETANSFELLLEVPYNENQIISQQFTQEALIHQFYGTAYKNKFISVKVLDDFGTGSVGSVLLGLEWVKANYERLDIRVVTLGFTFEEDVPVINAAIDDLVSVGVQIVAPAGNSGDGSGIYSPGSARDVFTIGALDGNLQVAEYSSRPSDDETGSAGRKPDFVVPGGDNHYLGRVVQQIISAIPNNRPETRRENAFGSVWGTSIAAAIFSAALLVLVDYLRITKLLTASGIRIHELLKKLLSLSSYFPKHSASLGDMNLSNPYQDEAYGFGIPNFARVITMYQSTLALNHPEEIGPISDPQNLIFAWKIDAQRAIAKDIYVDTTTAGRITLVNTNPADGEIIIMHQEEFNGSSRFTLALTSGLIGQIDNLAIILKFNSAFLNLADGVDYSGITMFGKRQPFVNITSLKMDNIVNQSFHLSFTSLSNKVELFIDGIPSGNVSSGVNLDLTHGQHMIEIVEVIDNIESRDAIIVEVDRITPFIYNSVTNGSRIDVPLEMAFTFSENISRFQVQIDNILINDTNDIDRSSITYLLVPNDFMPGIHDINLMYYDTAGNKNHLALLLQFNHTSWGRTHAASDLFIRLIDDLSISYSFEAFSNFPDTVEVINGNTTVLEEEWDGNTVVLDLVPTHFGSNQISIRLHTVTKEIYEKTIEIILLDVTIPRIILPDLLGSAKSLIELDLETTYQFEIIVSDHQLVELSYEINKSKMTMDIDPSQSLNQINQTINFILTGDFQDHDKDFSLVLKVSDKFFNSNYFAVQFHWFDHQEPLINDLAIQKFTEGEIFRRTVSWVEAFPVALLVRFNSKILVDIPIQNNSKVIFIAKLPPEVNQLQVTVTDVAGTLAERTFNIIGDPKGGSITPEKAGSISWLGPLVFYAVLLIIRRKIGWTSGMSMKVQG